jgi:hypothetical protein
LSDGDLGVHVRRVLLTQARRAPIRRSWWQTGDAARAVVSQQQARELHRILERDEHRQLTVHRRLVVLEHAVTESVADAVRQRLLRRSSGSIEAGREVGDQIWPLSSSRKKTASPPMSDTGSLCQGVSRNSWAFSHQV